MEILGWLILSLAVAGFTLVVVGGNLFSSMFSGKGLGFKVNICCLIVIVALWYVVFKYFPFEVKIK